MGLFLNKPCHSIPRKEVFSDQSYSVTVIVSEGSASFIPPKNTDWLGLNSLWVEDNNWTNGAPLIGDHVFINRNQITPIPFISVEHPCVEQTNMTINGAGLEVRS